MTRSSSGWGAWLGLLTSGGWWRRGGGVERRPQRGEHHSRRCQRGSNGDGHPDPGHARASSQPKLAESYPLTLTTAKALHFCHSQHRSLPRLRKPNPDPLVDLHPLAARARGVSDGDWVVVETANGSMHARARFNVDLLPDVVCAQFGWWQACPSLGLPGYDAVGAGSANYNALIGSDAADPISGSTPLRSYLCEVRSDR